jgi:preprotein translocase subunit SecG
VEILRIVLEVIFVIVCVALTTIVLLQEGKSAGLSGSISGAAESYWGKNKGRSMEGKLEKWTTILAIVFFVFAFILNLNF